MQKSTSGCVTCHVASISHASPLGMQVTVTVAQRLAKGTRKDVTPQDECARTADKRRKQQLRAQLWGATANVAIITTHWTIQKATNLEALGHWRPRMWLKIARTQRASAWGGSKARRLQCSESATLTARRTGRSFALASWKATRGAVRWAWEFHAVAHKCRSESVG